MKNKFLSFAALGLLLGAFVFSFVGPVWAGGVDEKIQMLEQELGQLKAEQAQMKSEQIELKNEATAAAAALPTFSYRPGAGMTITAADRSWQFNFAAQLHLHVYNHIDGERVRGDADWGNQFTSGDLFLRRMTTFYNLCWANCFYDFRFALDADSGEVIGTQHAQLYVNFQRMNPNFPTFWIASPGGETARYVGRSSTTSIAAENARDLLGDSTAKHLGDRAVGIGWINVPVGRGDGLLSVEYHKPGHSSAGRNQVVGTGGTNATPSGGNENAHDSDRANFFLKAGARPFLQAKNPWLDKTKLGFGWQVMSVDKGWGGSGTASTARRLRIQSTERVGQVTVLDIRGIGGGIRHRLEYGLEWGFGPYLMRVENALSTFDGENDTLRGVDGHVWSIGNELFLFSPKGPLTGSPGIPGSFAVGYRFARSDAECGKLGCNTGGAFAAYKRAHLIMNEVGAFYYIRPALNVGVWLNSWRASNTPTTVQDNIGCVEGAGVPGKSCSWESVNVALRLNF